MSAKDGKYVTRDEADDFDALTERLAADLRKSVRQLENHPLLSDKWFEMSETFGRVATISEMESKLPSAKKDATLWETEEQALRFIMEDGKLNLCLRCLAEFKEEQIKTRKSGSGPMLDFPKECDKFEKGVGTVFKNAWLHVEVLQTTDLPLLLNHIAITLQAAIELPELVRGLLEEHDFHQRQESLVFNYLYGICKFIDDIKEHRVMPIIRDKGIFMLCIRFLQLCGKRMPQMQRCKAGEAMSAIIETEDFVTYADSYYSSRGSDLTVLCDVKDNVFDDILRDVSLRRSVRPLIDVIDKARRVSARSESGREVKRPSSAFLPYRK